MASFFNQSTREATEDWLFLVSLVLTQLTQSGATADRPTAQLWTGRPYFDTTLGHPIWYDGTGWIDSAGNSV